MWGVKSHFLLILQPNYIYKNFSIVYSIVDNIKLNKVK